MPARPRFVLFGDSITQQAFDVDRRGWAAQLANRYARRVDVVNRGYSGWNTSWALYVQDALFRADGDTQGPLLATVMLGSNDMAENEHQGVDVETYEANMDKLLQGFAALPPAARPQHVVVLTPPPVDEDAWRKYREATSSGAVDRHNERAKLFAEASVRAANRAKVPVIDLWTGMQLAMPNGAWKKALTDGLHLDAAGNDYLFRSLVALLDANPALHVDAIAPDAPLDMYKTHVVPDKPISKLPVRVSPLARRKM